MNAIVFIQDQEPLTTSLAIAEGTDNDHASVIKLVRTYQNDLEEFGSLGFEIRESRADGRGGEPTTFALLNEQQATLLITYMRNSDIVRQFKKALVRAFFEMRNRLLEDSGDYKRVDVNMKHTRGITNPHGLDIRYTLDLTKICMNPNQRGLQLLEKLTGIDMSDIAPDDGVLPSRVTSSLQQFISDWSTGQIHGLPFCPCSRTQLYSRYLRYCDQQGISNPVNHRQFANGVRMLPGWTATEVSTTDPLTGQRFTRKMILPPESLLLDTEYSPRNWPGKGVWLFNCHEAFSSLYLEAA